MGVVLPSGHCYAISSITHAWHNIFNLKAFLTDFIAAEIFLHDDVREGVGEGLSIEQHDAISQITGHEYKELIRCKRHMMFFFFFFCARSNTRQVTEFILHVNINLRLQTKH